MCALIAVTAAHARIDCHEVSDFKRLYGSSLLYNGTAEFVSVNDIRRMNDAGRNGEAVQITAADTCRIHSDQDIRIFSYLGNNNFLHC